MNYDVGLDALKQYAVGSEWHADFVIQEQRLRENIQNEQRYGSDESSRQERARIVGTLNMLALNHIGISFNDLCRGITPQPGGAAHRHETSAVQPDEYSASAEDIARQQQLLAAHRATLGIYLQQLALTGMAHAQPSVLNGIDEARKNIRDIKQVLHNWNVPVADHPDDQAH